MWGRFSSPPTEKHFKVDEKEADGGAKCLKILEENLFEATRVHTMVELHLPAQKQH